MAQYIKQGNIFGRVGTGIGKGLAEQIPKEIERNRLTSGLKDFEQNYQNLTPVQQIARLSAVPGITPQMIQSFSDLARQQNQINAYGRSSAIREQRPQVTQSRLPDVNFANLPMRGSQETPNGDNFQRTPNVSPSEYNQPQIVNVNPLEEKQFTRPPWTPEQRDDRIRQYLGQGFLPDQAQQLASDDESRDLAEPKAYQERQKELTEAQTNARDSLMRQLEIKLQKKGESLFTDIPGEMLINIQRGMERDLRTNPRATLEDVANDWSNRALQLSKARNQFLKLASTTGIESFLKGDENLKKLKQYENIFKRSGNSEEYFNLLKSQMGLSPQGAASIAFPVNKNIDNYVSKLKPISRNSGNYVSLPDKQKIEQNARQIASDMEKYLTTDDSLLSIAREIKSKDPEFDESAFFQQLREDKDQIRLNERQRLELAEGESSIIPNWADILILPFRRK